MTSDRSSSTAGEIFGPILETPAVQSLLQRVEAGGAWSCAGVSRAAQPFLAALLHHRFPERPVVVIVEGLKTQESFQQDLETWLARIIDVDTPKAVNERPLFYPAWEILPHESRLPHADVISERLETLVALTPDIRAFKKFAPLVVTSVVALLQRTFPPGEVQRRTRTLKRGDRIEPLDLIEWLEEQGYDPEAQVTQKGELALRGGILDVYPLTSPWPVRLEFFGDELESLRFFDPQTQVSREETDAITLPPGGELGILKRQVLAADENKSAESPALATLLDHLPADAVLLCCEPEDLAVHASNYAAQVGTGDKFYIAWEEFLTAAHQRNLTCLQTLEVDALDLMPTLSSEVAPSDTAREIVVPFISLETYRPLGERAPYPQIADAQRRDFFAQLHRWQRQGYAVQVFCNTSGEQQRFSEIWREYGFENEASVGQLTTRIGTLARGFIYDAGKLVVVTDAEIFGRYKVQRPRRLKSPHAAATRSAFDINFSELEEGDFVVHLQHGIGRFCGLTVLNSGAGRRKGEPTSNDNGQECLVIEYAPSDPTQPAPKLYVPVTEAHLISKYVGAGKARPQLNTLSGQRWAKAKQHAERAVRDLAAELLTVQAARESQEGYSFGSDTPWQREFEGSFLYEETPDQMRAIVAAKADMESKRPMDRLICGDVGFGKTEVAIRAAFKSVMGGKQVAILVPTTVLAQQHYNGFRERMADYPVRVELLSRFRTRREQQAVIKNLATGAVDIVIGTHRLVQSDIAFKDLGLVVIDEEQRFGVMHKEKFKLLRKLVDVLTLSATPIPRTLYLALTGARDMSTIETPPQDRLPVETIVTQFDERVIRDAIQRELNREGQIFFLHNRVSTIDAMAQRLKALVPHARLVVGHGQMDPDDLEKVMTSFVNGEADILLSTTIIESGLDIPNANTIIIDRADRFGLSELYQLRGRVGRYKHQAYAYLMLPRHAGLLSDARKRISAIKQYSTLGSGFKIAMRDLEIRGAGNLLGAQQSGHITAVGFELYCQLLKQSVAVLKGEKVQARVEVQTRIDFLALNPAEENSTTVETQPAKSKAKPEFEINIPREVGTYTNEPKAKAEAPKQPVARVPAYLPYDFIGESQQRIDIYRKLAQATDFATLKVLKEELRDRFGRLPFAVELLFLVGEIKLLAAERNITVIETREDRLMLLRNNDWIMVGDKFPRLTKREAKARLNEIRRLLLAL